MSLVTVYLFIYLVIPNWSTVFVFYYYFIYLCVWGLDGCFMNRAVCVL